MSYIFFLCVVRITVPLPQYSSGPIATLFVLLMMSCISIRFRSCPRICMMVVVELEEGKKEA